MGTGKRLERGMVGKMVSHYRLVEKIGEGGMGVVYRAHDTRLGRDVAVKVLLPRSAATPEVRAGFEREARTISQLNHPHICVLQDIGHQDGMDFLVMELLDGETLADRLEKGPLLELQPLSPPALEQAVQQSLRTSAASGWR